MRMTYHNCILYTLLINSSTFISDEQSNIYFCFVRKLIETITTQKNLQVVLNVCEASSGFEHFIYLIFLKNYNKKNLQIAVKVCEALSGF